MKVDTTPLAGVWTIDIERHDDSRGFFARTFCTEELASRGLHMQPSQVSISFNEKRGTLRGLHFQKMPHAEIKIVRCTKGAIYDVALDLRLTSSTFGRWHGVELTEDNRRALYIPGGCAHGFQSLQDRTEVLYMIEGAFVPTSASGVRFDDPSFGVKWPEPVTVISERDLTFPTFGT